MTTMTDSRAVGVGGEFDAEAVAWAYGKLRDFGCYTREAGAMMGDRLNMMLLDPPAAPHPPAGAQAQGGGEVDATFAEWLATEMPAGTIIGDPAWWADRIARQYAKRCAPPSAPVGVEGFDAWWKSHSIDPEFPETMDDRTFAKAAWDAALAQQPAAVTQPGAGEVSNGLGQPAAVDGGVAQRAAKALLEARSYIGPERPDDPDDVDSAEWWDELTELAAALAAQPGGSEND